MTLLTWIKGRNKNSPLILSQINGLVVIALMGIAIYFVAAASYWNNSAPITAPFSEKSEGAVVVELAGDLRQRGIYYLAAGTTLSSFMILAGVPLPRDYSADLASRKLSSGMVVSLERDGRIQIGAMTAARRLALDLPIDINKATQDDLILIPGVKDATAVRILAFRQAAGGRIFRMEDLMQISGIKEKRLQYLKKYLYISNK